MLTTSTLCSIAKCCFMHTSSYTLQQRNFASKWTVCEESVICIICNDCELNLPLALRHFKLFPQNAVCIFLVRMCHVPRTVERKVKFNIWPFKVMSFLHCVTFSTNFALKPFWNNFIMKVKVTYLPLFFCGCIRYNIMILWKIGVIFFCYEYEYKDWHHQV